jgi:hypothetical protein
VVVRQQRMVNGMRQWYVVTRAFNKKLQGLFHLQLHVPPFQQSNTPPSCETLRLEKPVLKVDTFKHVIGIVTDCERLYEDVEASFRADGYCVCDMAMPYTRNNLIRNINKLMNIGINMLVVADDWADHSHTRFMVRAAYEFGVPVYLFVDSTTVEDGCLPIEPLSEHDLLTVIGMNAELNDFE